MRFTFHTTILATILFSVTVLTSVYAQPTKEDLNKIELGISQLSDVFPAPGESISTTRPMISADASRLEIPLDPQSVVIILNGIDVTSYADIGSTYITYTPPEPLSPGLYDVRITAFNINRKAIEPLSWQFSILGPQGAAAGLRAGKDTYLKSDNTTGRLSVSTDYVKAKYPPQNTSYITDQFREKEGMKFNTDLSFSNTSESRTILGSYHRETQSYFDVEQDKVRLNYFDSNFTAALGHFYHKTSELTLAGVELAGVQLKKSVGKWTHSAFSGRTQDPSDRGVYRQLATGLNSSFNWNTRNSTTFSAMRAYETSGGSFLTTPPAHDRIMSVNHDYHKGDTFNANLEIAVNERRPGIREVTSASDGHAKRLFLSEKTDAFNAEAEAYSISTGFFPIAEGSTKSLRNDRKGFRLEASGNVARSLVVGGEYENYDKVSTSENTLRNSVFAAVSRGAIQNLSYRYSKLKTAGFTTQTDSVSATVIVPPSGNFTETRLSAAWQDIGFNASGTQMVTTVYSYSINTWYRDKLGFALSQSLSDTDNILTLTTSKNRNQSLALNWNIIPFKLTWGGIYELLTNKGPSTDSKEKQLKSNFRYVINKEYSVNLGYDRINNSDAVTPTNNYKQNILRTGAEMNF